MRKLASIQRITGLYPITNADNLQRATVLGWNVVVKKDEFQVGDLVVYCEIDSVLPERPEFEFLRNKGFRIKTIKFRGQVSQGICFDLSILPTDYEVIEESDCTEILGVKKYEPQIPACLSGIVKGKFPSFIIKTDETRVQVLQERLDAYKGTICYVSEKLDGSSVTYYYNRGEFGVCSRNLELKQTESNDLWKFAVRNQLETKLSQLGLNIAIQGEIIGNGIQKNKLKIKGVDVMFFNVFDIDNFNYYDYQKSVSIIHHLGLKFVPIVDDNYELSNDIEELVDKATMKSLLCPEVWAEGIVIRPIEPQTDNNGRVSFKAINPNFLLKYE